MLFDGVASFVTALGATSILTTFPSLPFHGYDYIIVGGGTAGCALANRLSADPSNKVLVLEAGGMPDANPLTDIPFLGVTLPNTIVDWNYTSVPQAKMSGAIIPYVRGFALGGSSVVNLLTFNRPSNSTFNNWAAITGDSTWSAEDMAPHYFNSNHLSPPAGDRNTTGIVDPAAYGNGPVSASVPGFQTEIDDRVFDSTTTIGETDPRFFRTEDFNDGRMLGTGSMQSSVGGGVRSSSFTAYLQPVLNRTNLDVIIHAHATKIIPDIFQVNGKPVLQSVEVGTVNSTLRAVFRARKELILSLGVFGTPAILQRSGVGQSDVLQKLGIDSVIDLPSVGKNFTDHPMLANYYSVNSNNNTFDAIGFSDIFGADLQEWTVNKTGRFVDPTANTIAYFRLPENSTALQQFGDPSAGPDSGHMEHLYVNGFAALGPVQMPGPGQGSYLTILTAVVSPKSRGTVNIPSADPFAMPLIDPALYSHGFDSLAMLQSIADARKLITAPQWKDYIIAPFSTVSSAITPGDQLKFMLTNSVTVNHPVGSCVMSPKGADWGCVDPDLLLKGAVGLRIVDASIFPQIPESHTQVAVYSVAEKAATIILAAHKS